MIELPTPETDALAEKLIPIAEKITEFNARSIIKQLLTEILTKTTKLERERDEARAIAYDLASVASHCLGWHDHESSEAAERIADTLKRWKSAQPCKK